jgi:hypothetical protein
MSFNKIDSPLRVLIVVERAATRRGGSVPEPFEQFGEPRLIPTVERNK